MSWEVSKYGSNRVRSKNDDMGGRLSGEIEIEHTLERSRRRDWARSSVVAIIIPRRASV